jgi:hypothetical protein
VGLSPLFRRHTGQRAIRPALDGLHFPCLSLPFPAFPCLSLPPLSSQSKNARLPFLINRLLFTVGKPAVDPEQIVAAEQAMKEFCEEAVQRKAEVNAGTRFY